ncbi:MAG: 4-alpha-glucanotransferase [Lachnospiraceae bacterium]|nr:4-alpha-glucanotransferase [Lachnospiraceae bacterium]
MGNKKLERGSGLLMPISSLPSPYGIGTLGAAAREFADLAARMKAKYWQVLPIGPTSYGDSPYQSFSAFAGNPYFIDLDTLIDEGLLKKEDLEGVNFGTNPTDIDYAAIYGARFEVLKKAFKNSNHKESQEYKAFQEANEFWLNDYALYMAVKLSFDGKSWQEWDDDIRLRKPEAVAEYSERLAEDVDFWKFLQFMFDEQWKALKKYVNSLDIEIIGDIPLYVALDSSDVWVHPDLFELDEDLREINIAGVPPDMFSATGQRWGNPIYRWDRMESDGFRWWGERMKSCGYHYDVVRIDHFIGIVNYWSIPATCPTAIDGQWIKGPGKKLTDMINRIIPDTKLIAEDLGVLTEPVKELIRENDYPGMKILEFAFDGGSDNPYLPHNYNTDNVIVYIGTHDNETLAGSLKNCKVQDYKWLEKYYGAKNEADLPAAIIRGCYASVGRVAILQVQDVLGLDNRARTNFPSTIGENWRWRATKEQLDSIDTDYYKELAEMYGRA